MNRLELYSLIKNSKISQVATPIRLSLRPSSASAPTHQIIYTPKSSASRSDYGIKYTLPGQIGQSHIVYNDIDNAKSMPDVEKFSGHLHNRLKFQESGVALRQFSNRANPLFPSKSTTTTSVPVTTKNDSVLTSLQLGSRATAKDIKKIIRKHPDLHQQFQQWLLEKNPETILLRIPSKLEELFKEFVESSGAKFRKRLELQDLIKKQGKSSSSSVSSRIQGSGGFSYAQHGRLVNSPNGVKHGVIAPGRIVGNREAGIGGFVAGVNDRSILLQNNYTKNAPGRTSRQFVMPFKINEAEISNDGRVRIYADGVKAGNWMSRTDTTFSNNRAGYKASNPNFDSASERNTDRNALENLLGLISKD